MIYLFSFVCAYFLIGKLVRYRLTRTLRLGGPKTIRLTYDDGPGGKLFPQLLKLLSDEEVPATFFLLGRNVEKFPQQTRQALAAGHQIGSHTQNHRWVGWMFPWITYRDIREGITTLQKAGIHTRLFRPPFGHLPLFTWIFLRWADLELVYWDVVPFDWKKEPMVPEKVIDLLAKRNCGTVLLHAHDRNEKHERYVLEVTRAIIRFGKMHGWKFEKVPSGTSVPTSGTSYASLNKSYN